MVLPENKSKPLENLKDYIMLIYGDPKVGKSTFCSHMDDPLFIATEKGLNALSVFSVDVSSWKEFVSVCAEIHKSDRFQTIVIDTIDNLYSFCIDYVCKKHDIMHPQDLEWGKGWALVNKEHQRVLTKLTHENRGLVFVSHAQHLTLKSRTSEISKAVPTLPSSGRRFILGISDIILYAEVMDTEDGVKRVVHLEPSEYWEAGDRTGRLSPILPLDYHSVVESFNKGK